jgi:hypothetical protein
VFFLHFISVSKEGSKMRRFLSSPWLGKLGRRICTSNPFYVLSALLFLAGLRMSFEGTGAVDTWALMGGLAGYTVLLAVTACLLVRFCNVWDDVRTILLLVVLMFLATSVTFDELLALTPSRGALFYLAGLLMAIVVSEGLLRGIRLRLPAWFRGPYYLFLALFFLYPLALSPLVQQPHSERSEALMWGLFAFPTAAGLVSLTLLPAIRRGPGYVRDNGSPWTWPLYPWVLFGVFGFAVPARAYLLCRSLHLLGLGHGSREIFGPYFLVAFALAIGILVVEIGVVARKRGALLAGLAVPLAMIALALSGHRPDPIYRGFLALFHARLGADPLYWTLITAAGFYAYAGLRRAPFAVEGLTAILVAVAVIGPDGLNRGPLVSPRPVPLLAAAALQMGLGFWRRTSWRCLIGAAALVVLTVEAVPLKTDTWPVRELLAFHLTLIAILLIGAAFNDPLARSLRMMGTGLALCAGLAALVIRSDLTPNLPPSALDDYPVVMGGLLASYGVLLRYRPALGAAGLVLTGWLASVGLRGYDSLRQVVRGLDYLALSLTLFAVAVVISVAKSEIVSRWLAPPDEPMNDSTD